LVAATLLFGRTSDVDWPPIAGVCTLFTTVHVLAKPSPLAWKQIQDVLSFTGKRSKSSRQNRLDDR